jgi:hypothetical protein
MDLVNAKSASPWARCSPASLRAPTSRHRLIEDLHEHLGRHRHSCSLSTLGDRAANATVDYLGPTIVTKEGAPTEPGPKDTPLSPSDFVTVWVGQCTIGGTSVWHCHILSHEDGAMVMMMRPPGRGHRNTDRAAGDSQPSAARPADPPAVTNRVRTRTRWPAR